MPTICRFFGITIRRYYNDHEPAHFHAHYAEHGAEYSIDQLEVLEGQLPRRAHALVLEWAVEHRPELRDNWHHAREHELLHLIQPLE